MCVFFNVRFIKWGSVDIKQMTYSPRRFVDLSCVLVNSSLAFFLWVASTVLSFMVVYQMMVTSDTDIRWPWNSTIITLEVVLCSLVSICIIYLFSLSSTFLLWTHTWGVVYNPWTLNFTISAAVVTGASSWLEILL